MLLTFLSLSLSVRVRLDEVQYFLQNQAKIDFTDPAIRRSPEPAPVYDGKGVRVNTRERIAADKLLVERQALVAAAKSIHPQFVPPSDFKHVASQLQIKISIPFKEYPDYNFIGLIIGPRGLTQKQMEKDTGCKIAIRGKGSVKDGKVTNPKDNTDEPLHVMITAPDLPSLRKAEGLVRKLVTPVEENQYVCCSCSRRRCSLTLVSRNEHKRAQLRKLAEINGTLMGNEEHFASMSSRGASRAAVCRNCGAGGHPTYDCGQRGDRVGVPTMTVRDLMIRVSFLLCVCCVRVSIF